MLGEKPEHTNCLKRQLLVFGILFKIKNKFLFSTKAERFFITSPCSHVQLQLKWKRVQQLCDCYCSS